MKVKSRKLKLKFENSKRTINNMFFDEEQWRACIIKHVLQRAEEVQSVLLSGKGG